MNPTSKMKHPYMDYLKFSAKISPIPLSYAPVSSDNNYIITTPYYNGSRLTKIKPSMAILITYGMVSLASNLLKLSNISSIITHSG
jgi:hypothetical protein